MNHTEQENSNMTIFGLVPADWGIAALKDLNLGREQNLNPADFPEEIFEYYSIPAYQEHQKPVLEKGTNILSQKIKLKKGTVLFGKLNPRIEKVWKVDSDTDYRKIGSTEWLPIVPRDVVDENFLYFTQWSDFVMPIAKILVSGSTPSRQRVDPGRFYEIEVPLPPFPEQQKIAAVLSAVQEAIEKTEAVISAAKELKRSMMKHLFTYGPVPLAEAGKVTLKETEIGPMPEHWELRRLGEVCAIKTSFPNFSAIAGIDTKNDADEIVLALKVSDMNNPINQKYLIDSVITFRSIKATIEQRRFLKPYSVVFPKRGGAIGTNKKRITKYYTILDPNLIGIEPSNIEGEYLYNFFENFDLKTISQNTPIPQLNKNDVERILLPIPPMAEQKRIAGIFLEISMKIESEENKKQAIDSLFKSLLHHLMTGKVRVKDLEMPV